ncbi:non-ribosomal peptide synthetase [Myxococcus sp. AM011]|uniref:non-ribosomal peptide synthetase n=1 Tax=Myxococcus sp. AM011 TaxID=2745200 RepID=UPI001C3C79FA|nr:non-ribosomal peptide synthetase [Myxococcus sp. AM011]
MTMTRIDSRSEGNTLAVSHPIQAGLADLWHAQVGLRPEAIAIHWGVKRITYDALDRRANQLANALRKRGVGEETPVAMAMRQGIEAIAALVALIKLGATCVPLDLQYPRERIAYIMEDSRAQVLLAETVTEETKCAVGDLPRICLERDADAVAREPESFSGPRDNPERRLYVMYTSGTTGRPKGVEVLAKGIRRLMVDNSMLSIHPGARVAQTSNLAFDMSLHEIWGALLNGATVVVISKATLLDAHALREALCDMRVDILSIGTAVFNLVAHAYPDAFSGLRRLIVGGERANARTFRVVLESQPPEQLFNAYGPTEVSIYSTGHLVRLQDTLSGAIPIGKPVAHTEVFLLDEHLRPVAPGQPGELCLAGEGVTRGYLHQPELTRERFPTVSGLKEGQALRIYRSGDLARWDENGALEYLGRNDQQVKILGHRIELEEVSKALLQSGLLRDAVVTLQERPDGEKSLAAFVVPKDSTSDVEEALRDFMHARVSKQMVPARFVLLERLPVTVNGKTDRSALPKLVSPRSGPALTRSTTTSEDPVVAGVSTIWAELLGVEAASPGDDFVRLGGNSLMTGRLVLRLREKFGVGLSAYALHEARTLGDFIEAVRRALAGIQDEGHAISGPEAWREEARLPADIVLAPGRAVTKGKPLTDMRCIFLTGATGFLGAYVLRDLLRTTKAQVACLVRAKDSETALARIRQALEKYELWEDRFAPRIEPVFGDLGAPNLGMDIQRHRSLAERAEAIFHVGAHVNFVKSYEGLRAGNVDGTTEVLRLAALGPTPLHYVSTIAVFGPAGYFNDMRVLREDEGLDGHLEGLRHDVGYAASKWVAEKRVWEARDRGLAVNVYRPGFVMGHGETGIGNPDDFVARFIRGCIQIGCCPILPRQSKEMVTVDFVSGALLGIASREGAVGKAYHLVPPGPRDSMDMDGLYSLLAECGQPLSRVPYEEWVDRLMRDPRAAENPLCALVPMLYERVYGGSATRWELHEGQPVYDTRKAREAISELGLVFRQMDPALMSLHLEDWRRKGLLPTR